MLMKSLFSVDAPYFLSSEMVCMDMFSCKHPCKRRTPKIDLVGVANALALVASLWTEKNAQALAALLHHSSRA